MKFGFLPALAALCFAIPCQGETITVCEDGSCDFSDIQLAIDAASNGDVIQIAGGSYYPESPLNTSGKSVQLVGSVNSFGSQTTVIYGTGHLGAIILCTSAEGPETRFENLRLTSGATGMFCDGTSPSFVNCGFSNNTVRGMYIGEGNPSLVDCEFFNNDGSTGAGLLMYEASPTLDNCVFKYNSCNSWTGGGMHIQGGSPIIRNSLFELNSANFNGGGVDIVANANPTFQSCIFRGNFGQGMQSFDSNVVVEDCVFEFNLEGGFYFENGNASVLRCTFTANHEVRTLVRAGGLSLVEAVSTVEDCTFTNNTGRYGGAVISREGSDTTLRNCIFGGNSVESFGGSIYSTESIYGNKFESSSLTVVGCQFRGGAANDGGAIYASNEFVSLTDVIFDQNTAVEDGGAVYCRNSSMVNLQDCTFTANSALKSGGGIYGDSGSELFVNQCEQGF